MMRYFLAAATGFVQNRQSEILWKLSQEIMVNNERIGTLEVCYVLEKKELEEGSFLMEVKNLIAAIAENIAQIVERDRAEIEIRKHRNHVKDFDCIFFQEAS